MGWNGPSQLGANKAQVWAMLGQVKGPNSNPTNETINGTISDTVLGGGTTQTQSPRLSSSDTTNLGGGTI